MQPAEIPTGDSVLTIVIVVFGITAAFILLYFMFLKLPR